jgi:hypothetical protein
MLPRSVARLLATGLILIASTSAVSAYVAYETHVSFLETASRDMLKLLPRAMGSYIYTNRYDFLRGMTFMTRDIEVNRKNKDLEEIKREAYARVMRDIPFCVEALKGGELKLDTSASNVAGRLGMIAYSIMLLKTPNFPDLIYLEKFGRALDEIVVENLMDVWLFYDGYGDFNSLGELMERLRPDGMPTFRHVRNDGFASTIKEDPFAQFRFPDKFNRNMVMTDVDVNQVYNDMINNILDAFVYIWKCSGMDLAHPSYAAPPGTIIKRASRRSLLSAGVLSRPAPVPVTAPSAAETPAEGEGEVAPAVEAPTSGSPGQ